MPPVELNTVTSLADVILLDHFELIIPAVPGGGDGQSLNIRNMTAVLPGRSNPAIPVELHRHKVFFGGKRVYGNNSFPASYIESSDHKTFDAFLNWQDQITNPNTGLPNPKSQYATTGVIQIYDSNNEVIDRRTFYGLWVNNVQDVTVNGSQNAPMVIQVTLNFDYWK